MEKKIIYTKNAPEPIGPYSQAVQIGNMIFCSGQIAIDPVSGEMVMEDIEKETKQVLKNIAAVLSEVGLDFSSIIKTSIFLSDMSLFSKVNEVYATCFNSDFPARETVAVKTLPKNVNVEISVTAFKG